MCPVLGLAFGAPPSEWKKGPRTHGQEDWQVCAYLSLG